MEYDPKSQDGGLNGTLEVPLIFLCALHINMDRAFMVPLWCHFDVFGHTYQFLHKTTGVTGSTG